MKKIFVSLFIFLSTISYGRVLYVATDGDDSRTATQATNISTPWKTWGKAFTTAVAGDTVYIRGGVYYVSATTDYGSITNDGTSGNLINFWNYPGEEPILDFSRFVFPTKFQFGIRVWNDDYLSFKGLTIRYMTQNPSDSTIIEAFEIQNSQYIYVENMKIHHIGGAGLLVHACDEVYIKNCDAWECCDTLAKMPGNYGTGIGVGSRVDQDVRGLGMYDTHYYIEGCRAWACGDQGFTQDGVGYHEWKNCWSWANGRFTGSGIGMKFSIGTASDTTNPLSRVVKNCIFAHNRCQGLTPNNAGGYSLNGHYYNNFIYYSGYDPTTPYYENDYQGCAIWICAYQESVAPPNEMYMNNIIYLSDKGPVVAHDAYTHEYNTWDYPGGEIVVTADDFISLDTAELRLPRKIDGSLPDINFGKLAPTSNLIDAGRDSIVTRDYAIALDYYGDAPDLGWYEYSPGPQIIADHSIVDDYEYIPQYYIDSVKKMWVTVLGESHSRGYMTGLTLLETLDTTYSVNITESGTPESYVDTHLRASNAYWYTGINQWAYMCGEGGFWTNSTGITRIKNSITYCNDNNLDVAAIGFGWCWDMTAENVSPGTDPVYGNHWYGRSVDGPDGSLAWGLDSDDYDSTGNSVNLDTYLAAVQEYIDHCATNGYDTKAYFTTGTVDIYDGEAGYQGYLKNERIRDYVEADTTRILFDYADILCHDGDTMTTTSWNGNDYPFITSTNLTPTVGAIHISEAGALKLGKAMWWMLARIAGWDGNVTVYSEQDIDSTATDILTFTLPTQTGAATINTTNHTVAIEVSYTADITSLSPTITLSYGATVIPLSGVARDFTNPVTYTVTALDETTTQEWVVTVTQAEEPVDPPTTSSSKIVKVGGFILKL